MRRPFKMFFGIAIGVMIFFFIARVALVALVFAAVATAVYAAFRGLKRFAAYNEYEGNHRARQRRGPEMNRNRRGVEPLFHDYTPASERSYNDNTRYVETF